MSAAERKNRDKAMAARLKEIGETRTTARCPVCHNLVSLNSLPGHIQTSCGRSLRKEIRNA